MGRGGGGGGWVAEGSGLRKGKLLNGDCEDLMAGDQGDQPTNQPASRYLQSFSGERNPLQPGRGLVLSIGLADRFEGLMTSGPVHFKSNHVD